MDTPFDCLHADWLETLTPAELAAYEAGAPAAWLPEFRTARRSSEVAAIWQQIHAARATEARHPEPEPLPF